MVAQYVFSVIRLAKQRSARMENIYRCICSLTSENRPFSRRTEALALAVAFGVCFTNTIRY